MNNFSGLSDLGRSNPASGAELPEAPPALTPIKSPNTLLTSTPAPALFGGTSTQAAAPNLGTTSLGSPIIGKVQNKLQNSSCSLDDSFVNHFEESFIDSMLSVSNPNTTPSLSFNLEFGFVRDGIHRPVGDRAVTELCPNAKKVQSAIKARTGSKNEILSFGKEIFVATCSLSMMPYKMKRQKELGTKCGLTACGKLLVEGENFGYVSVVFPENHETASYPNVEGLNKNGLIVCDNHARASAQPSYLIYANSVSQALYLSSQSKKVFP